MIERMEERRLLVAGGLDSSFGTSGIRRLDLSTLTEQTSRTVVQSDGKIVTAGSVNTGSGWDFVVARFLADGSGLDSSFGSGGKSVISLGAGDDLADALALQADGKILVAGSTTVSSTTDVALVRLTDSGTLDESFGIAGRMITSFGGGNEAGHDVAISSSGDIFVVGDAALATRDMFIIKYNSNGALDASFGSGGKLAIDFGLEDVANSVLIQSDGKIVASGYRHNGTDFDYAIARVSSSGGLDSTFGTNGKASFAVGTGNDVAQALTTASTAFVLAGYSTTAGKESFGLIRVTSTGLLDTTFGSAGKSVISFGSGNDRAQSILTQTDGKILVGGQTTTGSTLDMAVARVTAGGALDTLFDEDGKRTIAVVPQNDAISSLAFQGSNKAVLIGTSNNGTKNQTTLARIFIKDDVDVTFGINGIRTLPLTSGHDLVSDLAVNSSGKPVAVGYATFVSSSEDWAVMRTMPSGGLDATFGGSGLLINSFSGATVADNATAVALDGTSTLVTGYSFLSGNSVMTVAKFNDNGTFDSSFDGDSGIGNGVVTIPFSPQDSFGEEIIVQPDRKILIAGHRGAGSVFDIVVVRLQSDGRLDTTFGSGGKVIISVSSTRDDRAYGMALQSNGGIIIGGYVINAAGNADAALVRLTAAGVFDTTFGTSGVATIVGAGNEVIRKVALQSDGQIIVAGSGVSTGKTDTSALVARFSAAGVLDSSFGVRYVDFSTGDDVAYGLAVHSDGRIFISGTSSPSGVGTVALASLLPTGELETGFGNNGTSQMLFGGTVSSGFGLSLNATGDRAFVAGRVNLSGTFDMFIASYRINRAPTDLALSVTAVLENSAIGTVVGSLTTTDADASEAFTYSLVAGTGSTDNASFQIAGSSLRTAAVINYSTKSSYSIRIRSTDSSGLSVEKTLTLSVTPIYGVPRLLQSIAPPSTTSSSSSSQFGKAVAASEKYFLAGAPEVTASSIASVGQAFVLDNTSGATLRTLTNPSLSSTDRMGSSIAVTGDVIATGAPGDRVGTVAAGRAMLFDATTGSLIVAIDNPAPAASNSFGQSMAASTGLIAIGAPKNDAGATDSGVVYIYNSSGVLQRTINNPIAAASALFGTAVDLDSTRIAIGTGSASGGGRVSIYDVATGTLQRSITNPSGSSQDKFGDSLAISGTRLAIGASGAATALGVRSGRVYIYDITNGSLLRTIDPPSQAVGDQFGLAMDFESDYLVIGAPLTDVGDSNVGIAYVYNAATGSLIGTLSNPLPTAEDQFGAAVAIAGPKILVGSPLDDTKASNHGYVHVFSMSTPPFAVTLSPSVVPENVSIGTVVGNLSISPANNPPVVFTKITGTGSTDNASFQIVGNQLVSATTIDFETKATYFVLVEATDALGKKSQQSLTISVSNVNEAPQGLSLTSATVLEDQPSSTLIGTLSTLDPDTTDSFTYTLTSGQADNDKFMITGAQLRTNAQFDYERTDAYTVVITTQDSGGLTFSRAIEISIEDLNPPTITASPVFSSRIVADLNNTIQSSNPSDFVELNGFTYFAATSPVYGRELFRTNRTTAGTALVKDLAFDVIDARPQSLTVYQNVVFFLSNYSYVDPLAPPPVTPITKFGLFKTDGTATGTLLVKEIYPFGLTSLAASQPMQVVNGRLVFTFNSGSDEYWATDGTELGTFKLFDAPVSSLSTTAPPLVNTGSLLYLNLAVDSFSGAHTLYRTDGTIAGSFVLRVGESAPALDLFDSRLVQMGSRVYFISSSFTEGRELWKTDGTVAGTVIVKDINTTFSPSESSSPSSLTVVGNTLYFTANDGTVGRELWKSDGTSGGTALVKDLRPGGNFDSGFSASTFNAPSLVAWNNQLYFAADNGSQGSELWRSDGTSAGTQIVFDYGTNSSEGLAPEELVALPNRLLFRTGSFSSLPSQLWSTDGTSSGTTFVLDMNGSPAFSSFGNRAYVRGNQLFFGATKPQSGTELWMSDGTIAGTSLLKDIAPGTGSGLAGILGVGASGLYFTADDGTKGIELGFSDGTSAGTALIDVARGTPASNVRAVVSDGSVLYVASDQGVYKVDDRGGSKTLLTTQIASQLTVVGGNLFFVANGVLWRSTGTAAGTAAVLTSSGGTISSPEMLTNFNGTLYYTATTASNGRELWSGNSLSFEFTAGAVDGNVERILSVGTKLYVVANGKLYVRENSSFTYLVDAAASTLMPWDNMLYFSGFSAATGYELWRTEGTALSTYLVADINPGPDSSYAGGGVIAGTSSASPASEVIEAKLVFRAITANGTSQLFASSGTTAGTVPLTSEPLITFSNGETASLTPANLRTVDGRVYFEGFRQDAGRELWVSDGTPAGTTFVKDLRPGIQPSPVATDLLYGAGFFNLNELTAYRGRLFLRTIDSTHGREMWTSDRTDAGTGLAFEDLTGTASTNPRNLVVLGDRLYFSADTLDYGIASFDELSGELFRLNEAPYAIAVQQITAQNTPVAVKLRGIDRDADALTFEMVTQPAHGTVSINGRTATYTPASGYLGLDNFTYRAFDGVAYSTPAAVTVGIQSSTARKIAFATGATTLSERTGNYLATVTLSQPVTELTVVPYSIGYGSVPSVKLGEVAFAPGDTQAQIVVPLTDNTFDQSSDQQIEVTLLTNPSIALGNTSELLITVTDNDPAPEVYFVDYQRTVSESVGTISFDIGLSRPSDRSVTTEISISGTSGAALGVDFSAAFNTSITFLPGQVLKRATFKVLDDAVPENREAVIAFIGNTTNATVTADPNRFRSLVWIEDDDIAVINVSPAVTLGLEGDSIVVQATRSGGSLAALSVPVTLSGNATSSTDFTLTNSSFQFAAGATTAAITVTLTNDGVAEPFEDVTLTLPVSASFNRGANYQSYIGIYDANRTTISLEFGTTNSAGVSSPTAVYESRPGGGNWQIQVIAKLSAPSSQTISVPVVVNNTSLSGYATPGVDFLFTTDNFVFAPGQTQVTRTLEIINDSSIEPDERIQIELAPTASQFDLRKNGLKDDAGLTKQLVIRNEDNAYSLTAPERVSEGVGSFQFTIRWDVPLAVSYSVYVNFSGSIDSNEYSIVGMNNRLTNEVFFASGEQSKTFTVQVVDDTLSEQPEQLTISTVTTIGDPVSSSVTVTDNDGQPTAAFTVGSQQLSGPAELYSVAVMLDRISSVDVELNVAFSGAAQKNVDFMLLGLGDKGIVRIPAGRNVAALQFVLPVVPGGIYDRTGVVEFIVTITGGQNATVGTPRPQTKVTVVDKQKQYQVCVNSLNAEASAAQTRNLIINPMTLAIPVLPTTGQIIARCGLEPGTSSNSKKTTSASSIDSNGNVSAEEILAGSTGAIQVHNGILEGSLVYFDANFNSVLDYFDFNQNGRQDSGEPDEPSVATNLGGSFALAIPADFDRNLDGIISSDEGHWVIAGGLDRSTNLPWSLQMSAPVGIFGISPITTLLDTLMRQQRLTYSIAADRVVKALDLGTYDLRGGQSIYNVLARDPSASLAYSRQVMINGLAITVASLISGRSGSNLQQHADQVFEFLASSIANTGVKLDLTNSFLIDQLLTSLNSRLSTPLDNTILSGSTQLISLAMSRLQALRINDFAEPQDYLRAITRIKKLIYTSFADDLRSVGAGSGSIANTLAAYTSSTAPNFDSRAAAQTIGIMIPPVLGVGNAAKIEGASGTQMMQFTVQLVGEHTDAVTVNYQTFDGTAGAADYTGATGTLTWPAGDTTSRIVQIPIVGDTTFEPDESFTLELFDATNAVLQKSSGVGFIVNDELLQSPVLTSSSSFVVYHGSELTEIAQNSNTLTSGRFLIGLDATLTGSATSSNDFLFDFSSNTYSTDHYTAVGGNAADTLNLTGGRFSRVIHRVLDSNTGTVKLTSTSNELINIDWSSIDSTRLGVSSVDQLVIYLPSQVTDVIVEDPDLTQTGQMRLRSASNQFAPIVFTVPNVKLSIVRLNPNMTVQTLSTDPGFTGVTELLNGGVMLSGSAITENSSSGSIVGSFTTQDPLLANGYTVSLVTGAGSTGNGSFQVSGNSLTATAAFDFETQSSYSIRVRSSDGSATIADQVFTISVTNLAELQQPVQIGEGAAQRSLIRQLVVDFDSDMIVDADAFLVQQRTLVGVVPTYTNVVSQFALTTNSNGGTRATITFSGSLTNGFGALADGNYQLTVFGNRLRIRASGLAFDGDRNGSAGGDYVLGAQAADNFFALFGDSDGNGEVGTADVARGQRAFGTHPGETGYNAAFDFDGNLEVGSADLLRVRRAFSKTRSPF